MKKKTKKSKGKQAKSLKLNKEEKESKGASKSIQENNAIIESKKIEPPHEVEASSPATHIPLLARVFDISEGDILEIGTGYFSTMLLHWLATITKRHVYSYENRMGWFKRAQRMENEYHHIVYCPDWDQADFDQKHWGLVFIDHSPNNRRPVEIERLKDKTDYMVIHDTDVERDREYGYTRVLSMFKYRYDYKKIWPYSSVVSNFKNLDNVD